MALPAAAVALPALAGKMGAAGAFGGGGASMFSGLAGPLISGGFSLLGGLFSNSAQQENIERQIAFQRELAQKGIVWKMQDAQRAGVHPLYAMGITPPSSFPLSIDDKVGPALADAGQNIGGAVTRMMDSRERDRHQLELAVGQAQLDLMDAQAQHYRSMAMRTQQEMQGQPAAPGLGIQPEGGLSGQSPIIPGIPGEGIIDRQPVPVPSTKEGTEGTVAAGTQPGAKEFMLGIGDRKIPFMIPDPKDEGAEQILSEMSLPRFFGLLRENANIYGGEWFQDMLKLRFLGILPPPGKYSDFLGTRSMGSGYLDMREPLMRELKARWNKAYGPESWKQRGAYLQDLYRRGMSYWDRFFHPTDAWERQKSRERR